jgi:arylsulfatase A-like enzyme
LIVAGPGFKQKSSSTIPTSNIDIVPTILHLYQLPIPSSMDGRVMTELLEGATAQPEVKKKVTEASVKSEWGTYTVKLHTSSVGNYRYIDFAQVERKPRVRK